MRQLSEPIVHVIRVDVQDIITTSQEPTERVQFGVRLENVEREQTDIFL